jgi:tRNA threonylcarbamoyl adenosine modification protein YeaZ
MIILTVRTDKPEAELGIFQDADQIAYSRWQAHRELSLTLLYKVEGLLNENNLDWQSITAIVFYEGPGSFTGLRIGAAFVNALSSSSDIPLAQATGDNWIQDGVALLRGGRSQVAAPVYGEPARTSQPRK